MKKFLVIILLSGINTGLYAQTTSQDYKLDQTDPSNVVNAIFYSARTDNYDLLENLCDPLGEGDGDTKRICGLTNMKKQAVQYGETVEMKKTFDTFKDSFKLATTYGKVEYETSEEGVSTARVPFMFNHPGGESRSSEVLELVKRDGKWYLSSF